MKKLFCVPMNVGYIFLIYTVFFLSVGVTYATHKKFKVNCHFTQVCFQKHNRANNISVLAKANCFTLIVRIIGESESGRDTPTKKAQTRTIVAVSSMLT